MARPRRQKTEQRKPVKGDVIRFSHVPITTFEVDGVNRFRIYLKPVGQPGMRNIPIAVFYELGPTWIDAS